MTNGTISLAGIDPEDPRPLRVHEAAKLARIGINQAYAAVARGDFRHSRLAGAS